MLRTALACSLIMFVAACGDDARCLSEDAGGTGCGGASLDGGSGSADGGSLDGATADAGIACTWTSSGSVGRPDLEEGRITGNGCNECECRSDGNILCTAIGCPMDTRCTSNTDCGAQGFCHFDPGCVETMGYCMSGQSRCNGRTNAVAPAGQTTGVVCGCDGTTYEATDCFGVRWENYGPC